MRKVIIVTGGSRGIGAATAVAAARAGYDVAFNYRADHAAAEAVADSITGLGRKALAMHADLTSEADIKRMFREVDQELGPATALVNNASAGEGPRRRLDDMEVESLSNLFGVNVVATLLCTREAVRRMSTQGEGFDDGNAGGTIINVSCAPLASDGSRLGLDHIASKGAIEHVTRALAEELSGEGIRVNAVRPRAESAKASDDDDESDSLPPLDRATCEAIAEAIMRLIEDEGGADSGQIVDVERPGRTG
ncbi:SDR family NAD(P)-dependent oxidoreductase [Oceanibacterium hippocampi]|uniref:Enoyl-[acyl-carrier-protein] reductase [NADPH] FabL n=1 Tax=Oceanibacterium hippocampi TaxID=745714 RepID=A0A1Y5TTA9_9PROT|nr:SDR family NAD(P)-dependent oxidoreductase [Oceanibacterium hippocampi]SLN69741.1 Enoyl-[acyl-carrier-protein] reductase [NADPH] FabL [Oceanibacterium hippocampi]